MNMGKFFGAGVFSVLLFLTVGIANGAYYVATSGNDTSGNGSSGNPWATITHALDNVPDGSMILVRAGTYNGRIRLRGIFSQGVTIRSEIPYQARLRNNDTVITCFYGQVLPWRDLTSPTAVQVPGHWLSRFKT